MVQRNRDWAGVADAEAHWVDLMTRPVADHPRALRFRTWSTLACYRRVHAAELGLRPHGCSRDEFGRYLLRI